jgi:putative transposase
MTFKNGAAFRSWCQRNGYNARTIALIEQIRRSPPSRNVTGGRGNVRARIPSHKMGVTIQSESRTAEKPGIRVYYEYDHMVDNPAEARVIEYYDQPEKIPLKYRSATGRAVTVWHTPDFFVIRENGAAWEEWKMASELETLAGKQPNRYQKDEKGQWHSPPGDAYAGQFGLSYRLRSNAEIDWNVFSNLEFLHEYLVAEHLSVEQPVYDRLMSQVHRQQGIALAQLLQIDHIAVDDVYLLIARRQLFVDLSKARLVEPERVQVYTGRAAAEAYLHLLAHTQHHPAWESVHLDPGSLLTWDGEVWELVNPGVSEVHLRHLKTGQTQHLVRQEFEAAMAAGRVTAATRPDARLSPPAGVEAIWRTALEEDYAIANARLQVLKALDDGLSLETAWALEGVEAALGPPRTMRAIRYWRQRFDEAEQTWGNGYVGLIPHTNRQGNYQSKLPEATLEKMEAFIDSRYEDLRQSTVTSVWIEYCQACEAEGITPASRVTFGTAVKKRPQDVQVRKRMGKRAAHQVAKRYWYLEATTPKHGERAWHIVHLDHTQLDIQLRHYRTGKPLGRPWATFAVDAYSRRLLAVVLTLDDQPSYRTCMLVLREMVRRFHRLPQSLYIDNGPEFHSTYFQALLAQYDVEATYRPPGQPRFGDVVERLFQTANTQFVYNLTGNTQIARQVRLMTKSNNPQDLAVWNLDWLYLALREWAYEIYDQSEHISLGQSPREAFEDSLRLHGERAFKWIDYGSFILNALPTPRQGRLRKVQPSGVKIDYIYYWHDRMAHPDIAGTKVPVRYDPFNAGIAYAYLGKEWLRCTSEYFAIFNNRTEQELHIAREELRASYRRHGQVVHTVNARLLADFLDGVAASERLQKQQLRDDATYAVRASIEGLSDETLKARLSPAPEEVNQDTVFQQPSEMPAPVSYDHLTLPDDF